MEFNKPVSNPMMVGSIELLKAEDTPEHRQMFLDELQKAKFLSPVVIDPVPVPDEIGRVTIARDAKVQFPMLSTGQYQPGAGIRDQSLRWQHRGDQRNGSQHDRSKAESSRQTGASRTRNPWRSHSAPTAVN